MLSIDKERYYDSRLHTKINVYVIMYFSETNISSTNNERVSPLHSFSQFSCSLVYLSSRLEMSISIHCKFTCTCFS